jgi:hypothetical protein
MRLFRLMSVFLFAALFTFSVNSYAQDKKDTKDSKDKKESTTTTTTTAPKVHKKKRINYKSTWNDGRMLPGDRAGRIADMMNSRMSLTSDQYNKVYSAYLDYYTTMDKDATKTNDTKLNEDLGKVLSKDQITMVSSMKNDNWSEMKSSKRRHKKMKKTKTMNNTTDTSKTINKDNKTTDTKKDATKKDATKKDETKKDETKKDTKK